MRNILKKLNLSYTSIVLELLFLDIFYRFSKTTKSTLQQIGISGERYGRYIEEW